MNGCFLRVEHYLVYFFLFFGKFPADRDCSGNIGCIVHLRLCARIIHKKPAFFKDVTMIMIVQNLAVNC